ncbi:hypothetical protein [Methylomusa anaerophila]|uniref:hypothetical protein n=1 Tax=Methylomusa anaerophila TaxID=1930071 RepID=UPI0013155484|nr:hypothetical protein [Methylomusa anaerophila]
MFGECSLDRSYCVNLASCGTSSQARLGTRLNVVVGDSKEVVICEIGANVSKGDGFNDKIGSFIIVSIEPSP